MADEVIDISTACNIIADIPVLLEAEVAETKLVKFIGDYVAKTGDDPTDNASLFSIKNKWAAELRIYFNDESNAESLKALGLHVEEEQPFHKKYQFRINHNELWWTLIDCGLRLGQN